MSVNITPQLKAIAKTLCRDLRKHATPAEKLFWNEVRNRKLLNKKYYRQYPLFYEFNGIESFFIADFFCFEEKIVIEIDGGYHQRQQEHDRLRTEIINAIGIKVLRFSNEEVENNIAKVLEKVKLNIKTPLSFKRGAGGELNEV